MHFGTSKRTHLDTRSNERLIEHYNEKTTNQSTQLINASSTASIESAPSNTSAAERSASAYRCCGASSARTSNTCFANRQVKTNSSCCCLLPLCYFTNKVKVILKSNPNTQKSKVYDRGLVIVNAIVRPESNAE